jgi:hypothetical protein
MSEVALASGRELRHKRLLMRPFSEFKATGERRHRAKAVQPKKGRARSTNRILVLPRGVEARSSQARRFRDIVRAALDGVEPTQAAVALARSCALASLRLDAIQAQIFGDGDVDDLKLVRLAGVVARSQAALAAMKGKAATHGPTETLAQHLAELARRGAEKEREAK